MMHSTIAVRYDTSRRAPFARKKFEDFEDHFLDGATPFNKKKALVDDNNQWESVDLLFQLSKQEIASVHSLFDTQKVDDKDYQSYLFFAIELAEESYSRTDLSKITREINKVFPMPVMVLFKHGKTLTLSVINRRLHKRDEQRDVLEKVTVIKDICIDNPHRAHIEILFDLSFSQLLKEHKFSNFVELHNAWQKTLDTKELNKRFYQELSNWYFWAMDRVSFPDDVEKDAGTRNAKNLIRLITRVIFVWFIKEKDLVPESLFQPSQLRRTLKEFSEDAYCANSLNYLFIKDEISPYYLLGLFNSRLMNFVFSGFSTNSNVNGYEVDNLPVCIVENAFEPMECLVKCVLALKNTNGESAFFERLIDAMTYELYLPEEIEAAGCEVLKHLTDLPELKDEWSDDQKLQLIEGVYRELADPTHPVSIAMFKMETIEEIRIIEGRQ